MEKVMLILLCLGGLLCIGMSGAMVANKPKWVDLFYFLTIMSEGAALVIAIVMTFLNL